jgi:MATE family multidrug resistance protein
VTHGALLRIALPMTVGFLTVPLVGIVSMAVVGHLGNAALTAGVALGAILTELVLFTFGFLRTSTTGLTAQAMGRGDRQEMVAVLIRALILSAVLGLLLVALLPVVLWVAPRAMQPSPESVTPMTTFISVRLMAAPLEFANYALFGWLMGQGRSTLGLILQTIVNGTTILAALLLVPVLGFGVAGAAGAVIVGEIGAVIFGAVLLTREFARVEMPPRARVLNIAELKAMMMVNGDFMVRNFVLLFSFAYFARKGAGQGDVVLTANAILEKFFLVGGYFLDGVAAAAETFAGQAVGARDRAAFQRMLRLTTLWGGGFALLMSAVLWLAGRPLIALMTNLEEVRATALVYLPWVVLTPIAGVTAFNMDGIYIGATWSRDIRNMMLASLALFLLAIHILMPLFGNHGLWAAFLIFLSARGLTLGLMVPARTRATFGT